eukprot:3536240-Prymnesium_polylepis.2
MREAVKAPITSATSRSRNGSAAPHARTAGSLRLVGGFDAAPAILELKGRAAGRPMFETRLAVDGYRL